MPPRPACHLGGDAWVAPYSVMKLPPSINEVEQHTVFTSCHSVTAMFEIQSLRVGGVN